ncbi:MAG: Maf family nucleotide pyrophosphatase [Thermodesulfobacteriota bacterium]
MQPPILLASTSPSRRELLSRLRLPFEAVAPDYAEEEVPGLEPGALAVHHAMGKARSVARRFPDRLVIGSDQVAEVVGGAGGRGRLLGKPGTEEAAVAQLQAMAGRQVVFHTGLAVVRGGREEMALEVVRVTLRPLALEEIRAYVAVEQPLGAAGSFHIEGLGIALMEAVEGRDFTALVGLPLMALVSLLDRFGVRVLLAER